MTHTVPDSTPRKSIFPVHTVGIEPVTAHLRRGGQIPTRARLVVVERMDGDLIKIVATDADLPRGVRMIEAAAGAAMAYGARLVEPRWYTVRTDGRSSPDHRWSTLHEVTHETQERALRDLSWSIGDARYAPHGTRRMVITGPDRTEAGR